MGLGRYLTSPQYDGGAAEDQPPPFLSRENKVPRCTLAPSPPLLNSPRAASDPAAVIGPGLSSASGARLG